MRLPFKERSISTLVVVPSAVVVAVLAVMQYRWSTGVSEDHGRSSGGQLADVLVNWQIEFARYFNVLTLGMHMDDADAAQATNPEIFERRLAAWRNIARYPDLVTGLKIEPADTKPVSGQDGSSIRRRTRCTTASPNDASKDLVISHRSERGESACLGTCHYVLSGNERAGLSGRRGLWR